MQIDGTGPLATLAGGGSAFVVFEASGIWVSGIFIAASIICDPEVIT